MRSHRGYAAILLVPVLVTGLALGAPRPARANDTGSLIAGTVLGLLLGNAFDRDYPRGYSPKFSGEPNWYYYPSTGVYTFPPDAGPYPYNQRWWEPAGTYKGRQVLVPARYAGSGERRALRYVLGSLAPIFINPTGSTRYCASCFDTRIEPKIVNHYGWQPSLRLGTYRRPAMGWYNGPGPDWYHGHDGKPVGDKGHDGKDHRGGDKKHGN